MTPMSRGFNRSLLKVVEHRLICGYGPRALHLAHDRKALFVGCKDGSIQAVIPRQGAQNDGPPYMLHPLTGLTGSGIRSMSEWQSDWLWVVRRDGKMELVNVGSLQAGHAPLIAHSLTEWLPEDDQVRTVGWIDEDQRFVSLRTSGTWVLKWEEIVGSNPTPSWNTSLGQKTDLKVQDKRLSGILFIVPLGTGADRSFFMANQQGQIFTWNGNRTGEVEQRDLWPKGEGPAFVNDFAILWNDEEREKRASARGIFLATDRGVYLLHAGLGVSPRCRRLGLPGLGALCMALTYAEPKNLGSCYLWAVDSRGDSHLFRAANETAAEMEFLPSGLFHLAAQGIRATSWYLEQESCLVVCQVRRNDQIVLNEYHEIEQCGHADILHEIRRLLSHGTSAAIRAFLKRQEEPELSLGAPAGAELSELFELLAEKPAWLRVDEPTWLSTLLEFLGDPSAEAAWNILEEVLQEPSAEKTAKEKKAKIAVELWTLSLLAIINRSGAKLKDAERESAYLGIIRWLSQLREKAVAHSSYQVLNQSLETSIGMVRKWGLFGEVNAQRNNVTRPLSALSQRDNREQRLDRLTYEALLFERGVDLQVEDRGLELPGRNGWDISECEIWGRACFAVSWHWGGVEIFELLPSIGRGLDFKRHTGIRPEGPEAAELKVLSAEEMARRDSQEMPQSRQGYSRAILLGQLVEEGTSTRAYLLTAPAHSPAGRSYKPEQLMLWELVNEDGRLQFDKNRLRKHDLPENESVYSLLDLGSGWVLAGLRSQGGRATCLLMQITKSISGYLEIAFYPPYRYDSEGTFELVGSEKTLQSGDPTGGRSRNRVWSLAKVETPMAANDLHKDIKFQALLGCQDGQILLLSLVNAGEGKPPRAEWIRVARMSSSVKALECRWIEGEGSRFLRVIAGGSDGSIVAWQELPSRRFASLWAAYEGEEIAGLHLVEIPDELDGPTPMVLGITRDERFVLFNDRPDVKDVELRRHPTRIPVPGCRHGSFQRSRRPPASAFATCLVPQLPSGGLEARIDTGQVAALLTASKHGVVRLLTLHYPHFRTPRTKKLRDFWELWRETVEEEHRLRLIHAVYRTSPSLELILVRRLLDPDWFESAAAQAKAKRPSLHPDTLQPWMLPRNLRPLLRLHSAWAAMAAGPPSDDVALQEKRMRRPVYEYLVTALQQAFRLEDLLLFQEICEILLQRGNRELFIHAAAAGNTNQSQTALIYLQAFEAIERSLQLWQSGVNREESLARITVALNMVDGDTFLRILDAAANEQRNEDPQGGQKAREASRDSFSEVLRRRIQGVRELIIKGDPRVSLEALRAANLSLLRLCKRLAQLRPEHGRTMNSERQEATWEGIFEPYFQELTAAAARAFRSPLEINDALAHGYARTFALCVCVCPSAAMRIATRLTETQLISNPQAKDDLASLVLLQFEILQEIGVPVPGFARELFRIAAGGPSQGLHPLDDHWLRSQSRPGTTPEALWKRFGKENYQYLLCLRRLYDLVSWFMRLEEILSQHPEDLDGVWRQLPERLNQAFTDDVETLYRDSYDFWCFAVERFAWTLLDIADKGAEPQKANQDNCRRLVEILVTHYHRKVGEDLQIRPITILLSRRIKAWAHQMIEELRLRYERLAIFQPEYTIFRQVLERLERAAASFPDSAAVRMSIVRSVLGHHLLEDLDEHILELQEIAHVLDPLMVRHYRQAPQASIEDPGPDAPIARRFAGYLMTSSERAESLPKNLRALFSLLDRTPEPESRRTVRSLLEDFKRKSTLEWEVYFENGCGDSTLGKEQFKHLSLILQELDLNLQKHPSRTNGQTPAWACVKAVSPSDEELRLDFDFEFPVAKEEGEELERKREESKDGSSDPPRYNLARLWELHKSGLQNPIEPRPDRIVASNGMGLYVANFAAAIVNGVLKITDVRYDPSGPSGHYRAELHLRLERNF